MGSHPQSTEVFHQPEKVPVCGSGDCTGESSSVGQMERSTDAKLCPSCYHVQRRTGIHR
jgi:hypothetical protein